MTQDSNRQAFLYQLYTATGGDPAVQASSADIGQALGLDEKEAGEIAQDLCIQGFAELKTLSGGIGITAEGLDKLDVSVKPEAGSPPAGLSLGQGPVITAEESEMITALLEEIRQNAARAGQDYSGIEEQIMDIKTIEVQMLSPRPKTDIIREGFRSLKGTLEKDADAGLIQKLDTLTGCP